MPTVIPTLEAEPTREPEVSPDAAWAAVLARDPRFDGRFVYAVASTGIFCRPVCPSRRPRRVNVRFFASAAAAEAAGYRACRRCRPDGPGRTPAARSVERARAYLDAHLDEKVTLARLARVAHLSAPHLQRTFKRLLGVSPHEYQRLRRAERLRGGLRAGSTVSRAGYAAGYGSPSRVYAEAEAQLGMTPAAYRRGGAGERIGYAVCDSPLGALLVACTARGVCAVALGESEAELEAQLRREFPRAVVERAPEALRGWLNSILARLAGAAGALDLPLDVRSTAFQARVWKALQAIPAGATLTYAEVAERIGQPGSARAVARACAGNPVALLIPCHRVVRSDGGLGGYRWGIERKRELLAREGGEREGLARGDAG